MTTFIWPQLLVIITVVRAVISGSIESHTQGIVQLHAGMPSMHTHVHVHVHVHVLCKCTCMWTHVAVGHAHKKITLIYSIRSLCCHVA